MKTIIKRINLCNYPDRFCFWLLSLVLLSFYSTASLADPTAFSCSQVTDIPQSECEALVAFYNQTAGEHWLNHSGWLSDTTAANWYGVTVTNNQITELTLDDNHLVGTLPLELCQLSQLQVLHLGHDNPESTNQLSGEIPACLGQLSQLRRLSLANNTLSGSIPEPLCQLTNLQYLDLSANELINGLIPSCLGANLSQLRSLNLQQLSLSGAIPTSLCQLTSLQALRLQSNQLNGAIPSCLGQLNQLVILWLYHNQLNGTIPPELCQLTALEYLGLGRNQLSGTIPACLGENLSKLQILYLSHNQLSGAMPATLGQLTALRQLYLDNNQLVGPFPEALVDMASSNTNFIQFHLDNNWFGYGECQPVQRLIARGGWVDTIPGWFDGGLVHSPQRYIPNFEQYCPPLAPTLTITKVGLGTVSGEGIDCGDDCTETYEPNQSVTLTAIAEAGFEFTVWGGDCSATEPTITFSMDAHKNCVTHFQQPMTFTCTDISTAECEALIAFYQQTGGESWTKNDGWLTENSVSKWYGITVTNGHVTEIRLSNNQLVGKLPTEICQLSHLQQLILGTYYVTDNRLIGNIPPCLGELPKLQLLILASNEFNGEIPPQLGQLSQLITLDLRDNPLEGTLPETLCELTRLENLYLGINWQGNIPKGQLSGPIPSCFGDLLNLKNLYLQHSKFTGEIPTSFCQLVNLQNLSFTENYLSGEIPVCLGNLIYLIGLGFYANHLTGSIPVEFCNLTHLKYLSLGANQLSGKIPTCLQNLTSLRSLDLSINKLTGHIPTAICNLTQLTHLILGNNQLGGEIPTCIGDNLLNLEYLHLAKCDLTGQLPNSFRNLIKLMVLHLYGNKLDSSLPDEFINMAFSKPNLIRLSLDKNYLNTQDCRAIQILRSRGNWEILNHSPQNDGFDFEVDCAALSLHVLTVTTTGTGNGTITGDGINCGTDCVDAYEANTLITLTAIPDTNSIFTGWSGNCQGTDTTTTFTITSDQTCSAQFELKPLCQRVTDIESAECEALVAFYQGTDGDNWNNHDGWLTATTVNDWHGVTVHDGQVTELHLENNQLVGTLPTAVCQLSYLEKLTLNTNQLSGTLPACLGNLTQLDLHDNDFISPLTEELIQTMVSNLQLRQLNLAHNQLGLPDCTAIQTLKQRGGWLDNGFIHSPQTSGFNFDTDCPTFATLNITKLGNGRGTVKAKHSGDDWTLNCSATCTQASESYDFDSEILLTATSATGFQFDHWEGDCSGTQKTVTLHLDTDKTCQAYFNRDPNVVMHSLTLDTVGQGTVISQPLAGINCQPQCQADYLPNQKVKLQAQPAPNYLFIGWSEDCQGLHRQTTVVMDAAKTCTATFQAYNPTDLFTLTITKTGLGRGKIWGYIKGEKTSLACQYKCQQIQQLYAAGNPVILTVHPDKGFIFSGWTGDCANIEAKTTVLMTAAKNCTAHFDLDPNVPLYPLTVQLIGTGKGQVTGPAWVGGQDCGNDCTAYYPADDTARLRARPAPCSTFLGWSGDCQGDKLGTTLEMTAERVCYAHFQSELEQVAASLIDEFYTQATLSSGAIAERYPRTDNESRLKEAFWLAQVPLMQIDQHLQATQLWPSQFNDLTQYSVEPVGEFTHSLTIREQWLEIQVELQNAQGKVELVGILVYYGLTPPPAAGNFVPVWLPREVLG